MIRIICFGKIKENYLKDLINDYRKRISKYHKIEIIELKEEKTLNIEANTLLRYIKKENYLIITDIDGESVNSIALSDKLKDVFNKSYGNIDIIIGSSSGIHSKIKDMANYKLSFSKLTFPHGLFRGILLEQIYRCFKIVNNEEYHK